MAFLRKTGSMLGRSATNHIAQNIAFPESSIFQAVRWMSSSKLFIGGLSWSTDDPSLKEAFSKYGEVIDGRVIHDRETGRSRGFGFITYSSVDEASAAIQAMDQKELHGRPIRVDYATERARGSGGNYGSGGGGGYSGGYGGGGGYSGGGNYGSGGYNNGGNYGSGGGYNNNDGFGGSSNYNSGSSNFGGNDQNFSGGDGDIPAASGFDDSSDGNYADRRN